MFQHLIRQSHFQIHARFQGLIDDGHIGIFDVATVFTQMQGNQVRTVGFRQQRRFQRTGISGATRIAQCGDMINIDT